jgi:hypothetical protein
MLQTHRVECRMRYYDLWKDLEEQAMLEVSRVTGAL